MKALAILSYLCYNKLIYLNPFQALKYLYFFILFPLYSDILARNLCHSDSKASKSAV